MKCEFCHINEACVEIQQITDGTMREVHMCADCAATKGFKPPVDLAGMLMGGELFPPMDDGATDLQESQGVSCPGCHMQISDFRKTSRLGCAHCYEAFGDLLVPMLESMHKASAYVGKKPLLEDVRNELMGLKARLAQAIACEAYEEAATLRDQIKVLELADACLDESAEVMVS